VSVVLRVIQPTVSKCSRGH